MIPNPDFAAEVQASIPDKESAKILCVCQKGLRSLSACEGLAKLGYQVRGLESKGCSPAQIESDALGSSWVAAELPTSGDELSLFVPSARVFRTFLT